MSANETEMQHRDSLSEHALVEALRNYDESAFLTLVDQYQATLVRMAQRYVDDAESAKEVVQETWLAVLRGVHKFAGRAAFKTWLFTILINRARTRGKQAKQLASLGALAQPTAEESYSGLEEHDQGKERPVHRHQATAAFNLPEEQMLQQEVQTQIEQAIHSLPTTQREVIILRDVEGWPAEEVCLVLGLSEGNQRVLLHRARSKVRLALERYFHTQ